MPANLRARLATLYKTILGLSLLLTTATTSVSAQSLPALTIRAGLPSGDVTIHQVIYGNGLYLASTLDPVNFYLSTDADTWSRISGPDLGAPIWPNLYQQPALAFGANRFVCVSDSGKLFSSPDGLSWTKFNTGTMATFNSVEYVDSAFYAVGDSAALFTSKDGISWTNLHIGIGAAYDSYKDMLYGNGYLVLSASTPDANPAIYRSSNGAAGPWTAVTTPAVGTIKFLKDKFYAMSSEVLSSPDAVTWTNVLAGSYNYLQAQYGFTDSQHVYLTLPDYNGGAIAGYIFPSDDGVAFNDTLYPPVHSDYGSYGNHHYFVYGEGGMARSDDGVHYTGQGSAGYNAATNGNNYVKVGFGIDHSDIYSSTDFTHWTLRNPDSVITALRSVVWDSTRYLAGGNYLVYASPDGITWSNIGHSNVSLDYFVYGAGLYVGEGSGQIYSSTDGLIWRVSTLPGDPRLPSVLGTINKVRFENGHFFVLAGNISTNSGTVLSSTDGINFSNCTPAVSFNAGSFDDVVYVADSAKYYFFGLETNPGGLPVGFFSVSTPDPFSSVPAGRKGTVNDLPAGTVLGDGIGGYNFAYSHGHFVGNAMDMNNLDIGYLLWSSDGLNWNSHSLDAFTAITTNLASADSFRMEGLNNFEIIAGFSGSPLPITLLNFNAIAIPSSNSSYPSNSSTTSASSDAAVLLTWQTAEEQNSHQFIIQRNTGPDPSKWENIGAVAAAGQSNAIRNYSFIDNAPLPGANNYHLLLTDLDGSTKTSPIRQVFIGVTRKITVYPNPVKDQLTIQLTSAQPGALALYNTAGAEVLTTTFNSPTITLTMASLPKGIYHLVIRQQQTPPYEKEIIHE